MIQWAIKICFTVLFCAIVNIILPKGKTASFAKPLISLFILATIILPLSDQPVYNETISDVNYTGLETDENFLYLSNQMKIDVYKKNCIKIAENFGFTCENVLIEYSTRDNGLIDIKSVKLYLQKPVITSNDEHIVILRRLIESISEYLDTDISEVEINEK